MKRELLELGSIGGQRSSWGHNEGINNQNNSTQKQAFLPKERRIPIKGSNIRLIQRENTVISPLDRFELRVNKSTSSSLLPLRAEEPVLGAVSATPIIEAKKIDESRDRTQEDNFVSSAVRRATASSRKVRLYQTDELENLYRELTNQSPKRHRSGMMKSIPPSPVQLGQSKRPESSPMGKLSVLNIERPSSKDRNTALPTRFSYQSAHRPRSTLTSISCLPDRVNRLSTRQKKYGETLDVQKRCLQVNGTVKSVHSK